MDTGMHSHSLPAQGSHIHTLAPSAPQGWTTGLRDWQYNEVVDTQASTHIGSWITPPKGMVSAATPIEHRHRCAWCGTSPLVSEYRDGKCPNCRGPMYD